jgi:hypothetical protein
MYFCINCDSVYTITQKKNINIKKGGAKLTFNDIIDKSLNKILKKNEINENTLKNLKKSNEFKKLKNEQQEYIINYFKDFSLKKNIKFENNNEDALFLCNNCGNTEKIKDKTCIFTRREKNLNNDRYINPEYIIKSDIIHKTTNFKCPNDKCKNKTSASFYRSNGYQTKYICNSCFTIW